MFPQAQGQTFHLRECSLFSGGTRLDKKLYGVQVFFFFFKNMTAYGFFHLADACAEPHHKIQFPVCRYQL